MGRVILIFWVFISIAGCEPGTKTKFIATTAIKNLDLPTVVQFSRDGQVVIGEKNGVIKRFPHVQSVYFDLLADLSSQVNSFGDRGLLGLALDPHFPITPDIYVLYTYDAPIGIDAPYFYDEDNRSAAIVPNIGNRSRTASAVLSRLHFDLTTSPPTLVSETPLIRDWCQDFPSHSIGTVEFGPDGYLYVGAGEAASFSDTDTGVPDNYCGDRDGFGGSLRAQQAMDSQLPASLDGTMIRVDPITGFAAPDNPNAGSPHESNRKIIGYGLRNPFRFAISPKNQNVFIGDVGADGWEEINLIKTADLQETSNFGWPCYEGKHISQTFSEFSTCKTLYENQNAVQPFASFGHGHEPFGALSLFHSLDPVPTDDPCLIEAATLSGMAFTHGPINYPERFQDSLFVQDYTSGCLWSYPPQNEEATYSPSDLEVVLRDLPGPTDLKFAPDGYLYMLDIYLGALVRVDYGEASLPPVEEDLRTPQVTVHTSLSGEVPNGSTVQFSGEAVDADNEPVSPEFFSWTLVKVHCSGTEETCHEHFERQLKGAASGSFELRGDETHRDFVLRVRVNANDEFGTHIGKSEIPLRVFIE